MLSNNDINFIEGQLGIKLPNFNISTMLNYPFLPDSWAAEFSLCTNAKHLIELNGIFNFEDNKFCIGSDGGEYIYFIKLNNDESVYIYDFERSKIHMTIEANSWRKYLIQIEQLHEDIRQDESEDLERKHNKKWWQFWI